MIKILTQERFRLDERNLKGKRHDGPCYFFKIHSMYMYLPTTRVENAVGVFMPLMINETDFGPRVTSAYSATETSTRLAISD